MLEHLSLQLARFEAYSFCMHGHMLSARRLIRLLAWQKASSYIMGSMLRTG